MASTKFAASLNFAKPNFDLLTGTLHFTPPAGFSFTGATLAFQVDGVVERAMFGAKNRSAALTNGLSVRVSPPKKGSTAATLQFSVKKQDLSAGLTPSGLTNKTVIGEADTVLLALALVGPASKYVYTGTVAVHYTAKQGVTGIAKH